MAQLIERDIERCEIPQLPDGGRKLANFRIAQTQY